MFSFQFSINFTLQLCLLIRELYHFLVRMNGDLKDWRLKVITWKKGEENKITGI